MLTKRTRMPKVPAASSALMSAYDSKRTWAAAPQTSEFGGGASDRALRIICHFRSRAFNPELSREMCVLPVFTWEANMPLILWLLGAPIGIIIVLWLLHVI